jgi:hypothetical protein
MLGRYQGSVRHVQAVMMRKYLLAVLALIAGAIISARTAEPTLDANGNTAKILISKDAFTLDE